MLVDRLQHKFQNGSRAGELRLMFEAFQPSAQRGALPKPRALCLELEALGFSCEEA